MQTSRENLVPGILDGMSYGQFLMEGRISHELG